MISEGLARHLQLIKEDGSNILAPGLHITGFNGSSAQCPLLVTKMQFGRTTNRLVTAILCIVPIEGYKIIVGQDFLQPLEYLMDGKLGTL